MRHRNVSPYQLKRFLKHLCIVSKHVYDRENAHKKVQASMKKLKKSSDLDKELASLNQKINVLLETEARISQLGKTKKVPSDMHRRLYLLEEQMKAIKTEKEELAQENDELREALDSIENMKSKVGETKYQVDAKLERIERHVDERYREHMVDELRKKVSLLDSSYKMISKDPSVSKARLQLVKQKLDRYKKHLADMSL